MTLLELLEKTQALHEQMSADEILNWLMAESIAAIGAEAGSILLREENTGNLFFKVVTGASKRQVPNKRVPAGKGICGWVTENNQSQIVTDVRLDPRFYPEIDAVSGLKTRSLLAVPLRRHDRVIGVVEVVNAATNQFSENDLLLVSTVASVASLALSKVVSLTESERQVDELSRLFEGSKLLNSTTNTAQMLQWIADNLVEVLGPKTSSSIVLYDRSEVQIKVQSVAGARNHEHLKAPPRKNGLARRALRKRQPVVMNNAYEDLDVHPLGQKDNVQAILTVPMLGDKRTWGVVYADSVAPGRIFTDKDVATVQRFANQASIALRNARNIKQLQALPEITNLLGVRKPLPEQLNQVCERVAKLLEVHAACVLLRFDDEDGSYLKISGSFGVSQDVVATCYDRLGTNIAGRVAETGNPIIDNDIPNSSHFDDPLETAKKFQAVASVPIFHGKKILGTLDIHSNIRRQIFTEHDIEIMAIIARQISLALSNANLYGRLNRLVSGAPNGIIGIDRQGCVVEFNRAAERITGFKRGAVIGTPIASYDYGGLAEAATSSSRLLPEEQLTGMDVAVRTVSGEKIPVRLTAISDADALGHSRGSTVYFADRREFQSVGEFVSNLIGYTEEDILLNRIVEALARTLSAEMCFFLRYRDDSRQLHSVATYRANNSEAITALQLPTSGLIGDVFNTGRPQRKTRLDSEDSAVSPVCDRLGHYSKFHAVRDCLAVSLDSNGEPFGVLVLVNKSDGGAQSPVGFSGADESLLLTLAVQITGLLQQLWHRSALKALFAVGTEIVTDLKEDIVFQQVVDVLTSELGYRESCFRLVDVHGNLIMKAIAGIDPANIPEEYSTLPPNKGVVADVVRTQKYVALRDIYDNAKYFYPDTRSEKGLHGMLAVPLIINGVVRAVLTCYTGRPHTFTENEINIVSSFVNLAAAALNSAQLFKATEQQLTRFIDLEAASEALAKAITLTDALTITVDNIERVSDAKGALVCYYNEKSKRFNLNWKHSSGLGADIILWKKSLASPHTLLGEVLETDLLVVKNIQDCDQVKAAHIAPKIASQLSAQGIKAFIALRLQVGERPVGVLFLNYDKQLATDLSEDERAVLRIFADQSAKAIDRGMLFNRQQQHQRLVSIIANTTRSLQDETDVDAIQNRILEGAVNVTNADRGELRLVDRENNQLYAAALFGDGWDDPLGDPHPINEKSIQGYVVSRKESVLIHDISQEPQWKSIYYPSSSATHSELAVPIIHTNTNEVVGVINVEADRRNCFTDNDQQMVTDLAMYSEIAFQNFAAYQDAQRRVRQLEILVRAGQQIAKLRPMRQELQNAIDRFRGAHNYDVIVLHIFNPYLQIFEWALTSGELEERLVVPLKKETLVWRLMHGPDSSRFSSDHGNELIFNSPFVEREGIRASGFVQLKAQGRPLGVLFVNKRQEHKFTSSNKSDVIEFGRLLSNIIQETSILQAIVDNLQKAMNFDIVTLYWLDTHRQRWSLPVVSGRLNQPHQLLDNSREYQSPVWHAVQNIASHFVDDAFNDPVLGGEFVRRERIQSTGVVKLVAGDETVGFLFVNSRTRIGWDEWKKQTVQLFATQATNAIQNTLHYSALERSRQNFEALYLAGKSIADSSLNLQRLLQTILEQAVRVTEVHFATLHLIDGDYVKLEAAWPRHESIHRIEEYNRLPINGKGIVARAVREKRAQLVPNVHEVEDYIDATGSTGSELVVLLRHQGETIGVLNVEHPAIDGFDERDKELLIAFSDLAAIAWENSQRYSELIETKEEMSVVEGMAWQGMFGSNWWHTARQISFSIRNNVATLRESNLDDEQFVDEVLEDILNAAAEIDTIPTKGWLPEDLTPESAPTLPLHQVLETIVTGYCRPFADIDLRLNFKAGDVQIAIHRKLFDLALEKLVKNAIRALKHEGTITISTRTVGSNVEICVVDNGPGIPSDVRPFFLRRRIIKNRAKGEEGTGVGVLMAKFAIRRYEGDVELMWSNPAKGTAIKIWLPHA